MTTLKHLKGLKVIDRDGTLVGKLEDVDFNLVTMNIQSIVVHQGFFKDDTKILVDYIENITDDSIRLNIPIVSKLVGKKVFDVNNEEIGRVTKVVKVGPTNVLESIVVRIKRKVIADSELVWISETRPIVSENREEDVSIPAKNIEIFGKHVTLKVDKDTL
jgi:sporulation protein YlmC with PRC-barrel domain